MFDLTKNQRDHTCRKRTCLLPVVAHVMLNFKTQAAVAKNEVSGSSERLCGREAFPEDFKGQPDPRDFSKGA